MEDWAGWQVKTPAGVWGRLRERGRLFLLIHSSLKTQLQEGLEKSKGLNSALTGCWSSEFRPESQRTCERPLILHGNTYNRASLLSPGYLGSFPFKNSVSLLNMWSCLQPKKCCNNANEQMNTQQLHQSHKLCLSYHSRVYISDYVPDSVFLFCTQHASWIPWPPWVLQHTVMAFDMNMGSLTRR